MHNLPGTIRRHIRNMTKLQQYFSEKSDIRSRWSKNLMTTNTVFLQFQMLSYLFLDIYYIGSIKECESDPLHVISKLQAAKHHSCSLVYASSNAAIRKIDEFAGVYNYDLQKFLSVRSVKCFPSVQSFIFGIS